MLLLGAITVEHSDTAAGSAADTFKSGQMSHMATQAPVLSADLSVSWAGA